VSGDRDRTFPPRVVRLSELKAIARSPEHFKAAYEYPKEESAAMRFGTLVHSLILGGTSFVVFEGERRSGKKWDAFEEEHAGKLIVKQSELDEGLAIARKVQRHHYAGPLLDGKCEHELRWKFKGRDCAGKLDVLGNRQITDVKITASAEPGWFRRQAIRMAMHAQLAWYREGARGNGLTIDGLNLIAVEAAQPHTITVFQLSDRLADEGLRACCSWMERLEVHEAAQAGGYWPGYSECPVLLDVEDELDLTYGDQPAESEAA
jgi:hypothetical protein